MKKCISLAFILIMGLGFIFNTYAQNPGRNESVVVVRALFDIVNDKVEIHVNDQKRAEIGHNSPTRIVVPNGSNTLTFIALNSNMRNSPVSLTKRSIQVNLNSEQLEIDVRINNLRAITPNIRNQTKLNAAAAAHTSDSHIEDAIAKITGMLSNQIPRNSVVAVLSISSQDQIMAAFAIDELEYQLVSSNMFRIVDRNTLDSIRNEQDFQMSGEVSDDSAISLGNMMGASIVITGTVTGTGTTRRLTIKALDVTTSQILAMSREAF